MISLIPKGKSYSLHSAYVCEIWQVYPAGNIMHEPNITWLVSAAKTCAMLQTWRICRPGVGIQKPRDLWRMCRHYIRVQLATKGAFVEPKKRWCFWVCQAVSLPLAVSLALCSSREAHPNDGANSPHCSLKVKRDELNLLSLLCVGSL